MINFKILELTCTFLRNLLCILFRIIYITFLRIPKKLNIFEILKTKFSEALDTHTFDTYQFKSLKNLDFQIRPSFFCKNLFNLWKLLVFETVAFCRFDVCESFKAKVFNIDFYLLQNFTIFKHFYC